MQINTNIVQLPTPIIRYIPDTNHYFKQIATLICTCAEADNYQSLQPYYVFIEDNGIPRYGAVDSYPDEDFLMVAYEGKTIRKDNYIFLSSVAKDIYDDIPKEKSIEIEVSRLESLGVHVVDVKSAIYAYNMPITLGFNCGRPAFYVEPGKGIPFAFSIDPDKRETSVSIARTITEHCENLLESIFPCKVDIHCFIEYHSSELPGWIDPAGIIKELKAINSVIVKFV